MKKQVKVIITACQQIRFRKIAYMDQEDLDAYEKAWNEEDEHKINEILEMYLDPATDIHDWDLLEDGCVREVVE